MRKGRQTVLLKCLSAFLWILFGAWAVVGQPPAPLIPADNELDRLDRSAQEVMGLLAANSRVVLVDVRPEDQYELFHIPGSINIPVHAVKTKAFLRHRPFVLLDRAYRERETEGLCEELRERGFRQCLFLPGGFQGWWEEGGEIEGDASARWIISLQDMARGQPAGGWMIADVSSNPSGSFAGISVVAAGDLQTAFLTNAALVLVGASAGIAEDLAETYAVDSPVPVYVVHGAEEDLVSELRLLTARSGSSAEKMSRSTGASRRVRKGCGSCP
ncbi:MAG: rhodanese-like domain-containing protein [Verrucomicrobia bacterium]|nr:rhodanese-like domain-containing protein [Verrucomicrobiota bacterium]